MKSRKRDRSPDKEKRSRKEKHDSEGHQKDDESPKRRPKATDFMDDDNERGDRSPEKDKRSRKSRSRSLDKDKRSRKSRSRSPEKDKRSRRSRSRSPDKDKRSRKSRSRSPDKNKRSRKSRSRSPDKGKRSRKEKHGSKRHRKENESPKRRPKATDFMDDDNERWEEKNERSAEAAAVAPAKKPVDPFLTRAGGAYIPPAKLKMMQAQMADKGSEQYQRMNWERIKKKIHGSVNKVNVANVVNITRELLQDNVIRGKGLLSRSIIQAQSFSPTFSHVYAALVGIINSKFPNIGELILRRLVIQFKRSFRRNDKPTCVTVCKFIAHLTNQRVAHEALVLEMLVLLMEKPTDDSIEVAITLLKECGDMLSKISPGGTHAVFESLRTILTDCDSLDVRTQYMIEVMMTIRKEKFKGYPAIIDELDLIDEDDQISHLVELVPEDGKPLNPELELNIFKFDPEFEKNEAMYEEIRKEIIGDPGETTDEEAGDEAGSDEEAQQAPEAQTQTIIDYTEQDLVAFRRRVYLTIQSSLDFQEAAHKLIKNELKPKMESELCHMIVDCCAQQRTYERFFGLLSERFCKLRKEFQESFEKIARDIYNAIHRFEIVKLRNVSKLIAHLLSSDAISWEVLSEIKLTEEDTSSASRIYLKIVFQELAEIMGVVKLYERLHDPTMLHHFEGLFPRDHPKNTRFAINFFSLIGLAGLTVDLREFLAKKSKKEVKEEEEGEESSSSNESSDDSSSDSSSSSDSDSSSASSVSSEKVKRKRRKKD